MEDNSIFAEIADLLLDKVGKFKNLDRNTRLSEDLKIDGDDAAEFIYEFSLRFNVDLSNFKFNKYFSNEGFNPIILIKYLLGLKKYDSISLGDLEEYAKKGKWE